MLMGKRTVELFGSNTYEDYTNHRKAVICMQTLNSKGLLRRKTTGSAAEFNGLIYDSKPLFDSPAIIKKLYSKE